MAYTISRGGKLLFSEFNELKNRVAAILDDSASNPVHIGYGYPRLDPRGPVYKTVTTGTAGQPYIAPSGPIYGAGSWNMSQSTPPTNHPRGQVVLWTDGASVAGKNAGVTDIASYFKGRHFNLIEIYNPSAAWQKSQVFIDAASNNVGTGTSSPSVGTYGGYVPYIPVSYRPTNWVNSYPANPAVGDTVVMGGTSYDYKIFNSGGHIGNVIIYAPRLYTYSRPITGYTNPGQPFIPNTLKTETVLDYYTNPNAGGYLMTFGRLVSYVDWANLRDELNIIYKHQFGSDLTDAQVPILGRGHPVTSDAFSKMNAILTIVEANPLRYHANGMGVFALGTGTRASTWGTSASSITSIDTVTFTNTNAARYFFNSGGGIRLSYSHPRITTTPQDLDWMEMTARIGTISINATTVTQSGNTGMAIASNLGGWYALSTSELTVLNAVNAGNVYRHVTYTQWNQFTASYQVNDARITIRKVAPTTTGGPLSLVITTTFTDDHTSPWYDRVAAGTKITVQAGKAVDPLTNITTPTYSTTNFTSTAPAQTMMVSRMMFSNPTTASVVVNNTRMFRLNYSSNNSTVTNAGEFTVSVPGETIEFVEVVPASQDPNQLITIVSATESDVDMHIEYTTKVVDPSVCQVSLRIKTYERSSWLIVDYLALEEVTEYELTARIVDNYTMSGFPVSITIDGNAVDLASGDSSPVDMASIWSASDPALSSLVPPKVESLVKTDNGTSLVVNTSDTSAVGNIEFLSHKSMMRIDNVYFADQGTTSYSANAVDPVRVRVTTVNDLVGSVIYGKLLIDQSPFEEMHLVSATAPVGARAMDGDVQVSSTAIDPLTGQWCVSYIIQPASRASFIDLQIIDGETSYFFRDVSVRNANSAPVDNAIICESNRYDLNSTIESPVFVISTSITSAGNGQLTVGESTGSITVDAVIVNQSSRLAGAQPTKVKWANEGASDGKYSMKYQAKESPYCDIRITSGSRVYQLSDVNLSKSSVESYIGRLEFDPETAILTSQSSVSVYSDTVKISLTVGSDSRRVVAFKTSGKQWSSGWEPADPPKFDGHGASNANDSLTKEITIPMSDWTTSSSKMLYLEVKFADGLYCYVEFDLLKTTQAVPCSLLERYN